LPPKPQKAYAISMMNSRRSVRLLRYLAIVGFALVGGVVWILMRFQMTVLWCVLGHAAGSIQAAHN